MPRLPPGPNNEKNRAKAQRKAQRERERSPESFAFGVVDVARKALTTPEAHQQTLRGFATLAEAEAFHTQWTMLRRALRAQPGHQLAHIGQRAVRVSIHPTIVQLGQWHMQFTFAASRQPLEALVEQKLSEWD